MADGENETVDTEVQETTDAFDGEFDPERYKAAMTKKNSENASLRARLKEAEAAAAELAQIKKAKEDANKSAEERLEELSRQASKLQKQVWKSEIQSEFGLKAEHMKWIKGSTQEELRAAAEEFQKEVLGGNDLVEYDEDAAAAELSPFGNRRNVTDASRSRATGGVADPVFDAEKIAKEIASDPWA